MKGSVLEGPEQRIDIGYNRSEGLMAPLRRCKDAGGKSAMESYSVWADLALIVKWPFIDWATDAAEEKGSGVYIEQTFATGEAAAAIAKRLNPKSKGKSNCKD